MSPNDTYRSSPPRDFDIPEAPGQPYQLPAETNYLLSCEQLRLLMTYAKAGNAAAVQINLRAFCALAFERQPPKKPQPLIVGTDFLWAWNDTYTEARANGIGELRDIPIILVLEGNAVVCYARTPYEAWRDYNPNEEQS